MSSAIRHLLEAQEASGGSLSVVVAQLGGLIELGLVMLLTTNRSVQLLACGLDVPQLEATVAVSQPSVAVLGEAHVRDPAIFDRLREVRPGIGLAVLACGARSIRFRPPLVFTEAEAGEALGILREVLKGL